MFSFTFIRVTTKIATQTYLHKYLKRPLPKEKKVQTKISSFLKPTTEKEYNYSMDVVYVEGNHFDIKILCFFVNETHTSFTRPLTS